MKGIKQKIMIFCLLVVSINLSAQGYKLPDYKNFKLPNGLTIYLMEQHDVPVISVSVILSAGAIYDGDKAGLASLTATALKHGTKNFPKTKLDEELDFIGANVDTYAQRNFQEFPLNLLQKIRIKCWKLLKKYCSILFLMLLSLRKKKVVY